MATAKILFIQNQIVSSSISVNVYSDGRLSHSFTVAADSTHNASPAIPVPEACASADFSGNHAEVTYNGSTYSFWQCGEDIYYSISGTWNDSNKMTFPAGEVPSDQDIKLKVSDNEGDTWIMGEVVDE